MNPAVEQARFDRIDHDYLWTAAYTRAHHDLCIWHKLLIAATINANYDTVGITDSDASRESENEVIGASL